MVHIGSGEERLRGLDSLSAAVQIHAQRRSCRLAFAAASTVRAPNRIWLRGCGEPPEEL